MTAPIGFIEATLAGPGETMAALIAVDQIAAVKEASKYNGTTKTLVVLRCGETLQLSTAFETFVERLLPIRLTPMTATCRVPPLS